MRHRCGLPCNHQQIFSTLSPFKAVGVCNFVPRWTFTHSRLLGDDAASGTHSCEEVECPMAALEPWLPRLPHSKFCQVQRVYGLAQSRDRAWGQAPQISTQSANIKARSWARTSFACELSRWGHPRSKPTIASGAPLRTALPFPRCPRSRISSVPVANVRPSSPSLAKRAGRP